jgi:hypothetical protein
MSPEQMESSGKADSRSDIYGIGAVLYELLTHECPHEGDTFLDIYAAATLGPPAPPSSLRSDVPEELDDVILRCLRIHPAERYVDAAELAAALAPFGPEGSAVRAEAIARILEAARSRTHDRAPHDALPSRDEGSFVRKRPSRALWVRRRLVRWIGTIAAVLAFAGLAVGWRVLYTQTRVSAVATVNAAPTRLVPPPLVDPVPQLKPVPAPSSTTATTAAQAGTIDITAKVEAEDRARAATAARAAAKATATTTATATATAATTAAAPAPSPAPSAPAPPPERTTWSAPAPAPTSEEQQLFEDRK